MGDNQFQLSILTVLKQDAQRLYERIVYRQPEYINVLAMKRTRDHLHEVFKNKYENAEITDLKYLSDEVLRAFELFYHRAEEIKWYLFHTEDMPQTMTQKLIHECKDLEKHLDVVMLYAQAEIDTLRPEEVQPNDFSS